ncbi:MAG: nicotinate dehydrogenase subunit [Bryobacterales bacterium]|jgi:aerobic-type carbon monoxide dehydrogenase small subunit (CoxS/CutS family)|nr:nicotinate dehydrogenase subunit [Bryobacterales bacterium]
MDLVVNGARHRIQSDPDRTLLAVLRDELDLTGTKYGCGEGQCGACTVLLDGAPVRSCLTPAKAAQGKQIATIESLAQNGHLHPVQQAFIEADALQCGYCTSGMIMSSVGLLKKKPNPSDADIKSGLQGNVCRCGTYPRIVQAVRMAAKASNGRVA